MKIRNSNCVEFRCDGCNSMLAIAKYERDALKLAREIANIKGWVWKHPHWQLYCPLCR